MKYFIKILFTFILFVSLIEMILVGITIAIEHSYSFKISDNINKIVIGHSMTEHAINDSIYKGSINLSYHGLEINYNYMKLRSFLENNSQIDTIIFGIKPEDITINRNILAGSNYCCTNVAHYFFLFNMDDFLVMSKFHSFIPGIYFVPYEFFRSFKSANFKLYSIFDYGMGGYSPASSKKILKEFTFSADISSSIITNKFYMYYLHKILKLCNKNNVKLIFIGTPVYGCQQNTNFQKFMKSEDLIYYDFSDMKLPQYSFHDGLHLSDKGAIFFSSKLDSLLNP